MSNLGGQLVATEFQSMDTLVNRSQAGTRFSFVLIAVLASVAALLAAVGIYGVLSTNVRQRPVEIGVRLAVGATPSSVFGLIVRQGLILSAAGIAIGLAAALGLAQTMASMLVGVSARDPMTFVVITGLFLLVAATASVYPRAARRRLIRRRLCAASSDDFAVGPQGFQEFTASAFSRLCDPSYLCSRGHSPRRLAQDRAKSRPRR